MASPSQSSELQHPAQLLTRHSFLFRGLDPSWIDAHLGVGHLDQEKLYSNRPIYTAFRPGMRLDCLYVVLAGGPVVVRSTPLDRMIAMTYPGGCFGMRNLAVGPHPIHQAFPSLVEAYKTTDVLKVPVVAIAAMFDSSESFRSRYNQLLELREKFQYHLLNCSAYPPQAVATLLRGLIYQERTLGSQPQADGLYHLDLPIDLIARSCQLNHRTVEQVLKAMTKVGLLAPLSRNGPGGDTVYVADPEGLKAVYGATRDKVPWWPLK